MARIVRQPDLLPRLSLCEFRTASLSERAAALQAMSREFQLGRSRCVSAMESKGFTLLLVEAPQVEVSELKAAVRWRIKELLDYPIDEAIIDIFDIPGQQERGRAKLIYVVAAPASGVRAHIDLLEQNGVGLNAIDIPELCQRNIAAILPEDQTGVAFLHLRRHGGLLTLTRQGSLYLSRALDTGLADLLAEAGGGEIAHLLDGIVLQIQRSLDYYESHFSLPPASALVLAPTEQVIPGMLGHIAGNLGIPVRMLDLNALIESEAPLTDAMQATSLLAIGAALRRDEAS